MRCMQAHTLNFITLVGKRSPGGAGVVPCKSVEGGAAVEDEVSLVVGRAEEEEVGVGIVDEMAVVFIGKVVKVVDTVVVG